LYRTQATDSFAPESENYWHVTLPRRDEKENVTKQPPMISYTGKDDLSEIGAARLNYPPPGSYISIDLDSLNFSPYIQSAIHDSTSSPSSTA